MAKDTLQITITPRKRPKTKFGRWWEDKISYPFYSKKIQFKAWFWGGLYRGMLKFGKWIVPNHMHDEVFGPDEEEFEVTINMEGYDEETEKQLFDAIIKGMEKTKND